MRLAAALLACSCAAVLGAQQPAPAFTIDHDAAIVTIFIKPDKVAVFDDVLQRLRDSLAQSGRPMRREQAAGWQVFRSLDGQGMATYIFRIDPAVRGQEYDLTRLIGELYPDDVVTVNLAYRDAQLGRAVMAMNRVRIGGLGEPSDLAAPLPASAPAVTPLTTYESVDAVLITMLVRPERTQDFESTLALLGRAMQNSPVQGRKRQAAGWKVFRGMQAIDGQVPYVIGLDPVLPNAEYDVIRLIQETYPQEVGSAFDKFRGSFVGQAIVRLGDRLELAK